MKTFLFLTATLFLTLASACKAEESEQELGQLEVKCEKALIDWLPSQKIPNDCQLHLAELLRMFGKSPSEPFYEYGHRIKHDSRFTTQLEIKRQLSEACVKSRSQKREQETATECELAIKHTQSLNVVPDWLQSQVRSFALSDNTPSIPIENQTGTYCYIHLINWQADEPLPDCVDYEISILGGEVNATQISIENTPTQVAEALSKLRTLCSLQPSKIDIDIVRTSSSCSAETRLQTYTGVIDTNTKGDPIPEPKP